MQVFRPDARKCTKHPVIERGTVRKTLDYSFGPGEFVIQTYVGPETDHFYEPSQEEVEFMEAATEACRRMITMLAGSSFMPCESKSMFQINGEQYAITIKFQFKDNTKHVPVSPERKLIDIRRIERRLADIHLVMANRYTSAAVKPSVIDAPKEAMR